MLPVICVEQVDEHNFVSHEATGDEGIWRPCEAHGPIIQVKERVKVDFLGLDYLLGSGVPAEASELKHSIVVERDRELSGIIILRKLVNLDVISQDLFREL